MCDNYNHNDVRCAFSDKQVLSSPDVLNGEYVSLAFSPDSKYLVAQGGKPEWTLLYWTWEKSKVMATTKTANPQNPGGDVYQVFQSNSNSVWILLYTAHRLA
jgi:hypothetical protein